MFVRTKIILSLIFITHLLRIQTLNNINHLQLLAKIANYTNCIQLCCQHVPFSTIEIHSIHRWYRNAQLFYKLKRYTSPLNYSKLCLVTFLAETFYPHIQNLPCI